MDLVTTVAISLIGGGAIVAGIAGIAMPSGERIAALLLTLVIGAGSGVIALAIGVHGLSSSPDDAPADWERVFMIASAIGFAAVVVSSILLWVRASRADTHRRALDRANGAA